MWRGPQSFDLSRVVTRWSLPPDPYTDDELGSGISWALHPHFCDEILGLFPEENVGVNGASWLRWMNFLSCDEIRAAVARSFDTWAANHKKIYFTDVTALCTEAVENECAAAEVYIYPDGAFSAENDLAAFVQLSHSNLNRAPHLTSGLEIPGGYGIRSAVMKVRTLDMCWYLDATFCYHFRRLNESGVDLVLTFRLVFAAAAIFSAIILANMFWQIVVKLKQGLLAKQAPRGAHDLHDPMSEGHDLAKPKKCGPLLDCIPRPGLEPRTSQPRGLRCDSRVSPGPPCRPQTSRLCR